MGTAQNDCVHLFGLQRFRIFLNGLFQFGTAKPVAFDQRHKFRTAYPEDFCGRVRCLNFFPVRSCSYGKVRGHQSDVFVFCGLQHKVHAFGHADDGKGMGPPDHVGAQHRDRIAGRHQLFDSFLLQPVRHLRHKGGDGFPAAGAVRSPGRVPQI